MAIRYEVSDMCKKCIRTHKEKKKNFKVSCTPVPKELMDSKNPLFPIEKFLDQDVIESLSSRELADIQLSKNKLLWAKEYLGWGTYNAERNFDQFYQREMLNCTAKLRTMRLGRRMGKCMDYEKGEVLTADGYVKVSDLNNSKHKIYSFDSINQKIVQTNDFFTTDNGIKEVFEIKTKKGNRDYSTFNHPYLVLKGTGFQWKEAKDLVVGDKLILTTNLMKKKGKKANNFTINTIAMKIATSGIISKKLFDLDHESVLQILSKAFVKNVYHTFKDNGELRKLKAILEMINADFIIKNEKIKIKSYDNSVNGNFYDVFVTDEVVECKSIGQRKTIAVSVPEHSTFVTDGIVTHNTEVVTVDALHFAMNNPGKNVMIIGPFQNLIDEIFDRIAGLLDGPESAFSGSYERKRQPNEIRLQNGSRIKGFTTGLSGDSIRGQSADRIYFDEAAYIPPTAFRAVLSLLMDNPKVSITATSTPSAVQTKFKDWCLNDPAWKEFHFQSTLFPYFHEIEETLRSSYTGDDFALEVLAEFIEGSSKVFRTMDIQAAQEDYQYINKRSDLENPGEWIISIGTDWNETKSGVQIVVMGFNKSGKLKKPFRVLKRVSLHKETDDITMLKNIQTRGVEAIKELYHSFQADYVYVDQGHGSMQNEILSEYFYKINKIHCFKGVDFSSNYAYEDLYTGEVKQKRKKVMMIYFLQKRFEMREITYSAPEEKEKGMMTNQLMEYNIDRYDSKDQPIFVGLDHILDALMLSVFAIVENCTTLFDRKTGNYVGTIARQDVSNFSKEELPEAKKEAMKQLEKLSGTVNVHNSGSLSGVMGVTSLQRPKRRGRSTNFDIL